MAIKIIITQEFYDTTKIPEAMDIVSTQLRHGMTKSREAPTWHLVDDES